MLAKWWGTLKNQPTQIIFEYLIFSLLLLYIVALPVSFYAAKKIIYTIVTLFFFYFILSRDKKLFIDKILLVAMLYLLASSLSLINAPHELWGWVGNGLRRIFLCIFFMLAIAHVVNSEKKIMSILVCLSLTLFSVSLYSFYQYSFDPTFYQFNINRAHGGMGHPTLLSTYVGAHVFLFICLGFFYFEKYQGIFLKIASLTCILTLVLTFSRSSALAITITSTLLLFIKKNKTLVLCGFITLVISTGLILLSPGATQWIKNSQSPLHLYLGGYNQFGGDSSQRVNQWKAALNAFHQHPLIGIGVNTFPPEYYKYKLVPDPFTAVGVHNTYLEHLAETGIAGSTALGILLVTLYAMAIKIYKKSSSKLNHILSLGLGLSLTAFLIQAIAESSLQAWRIATVFWFTAGLIVALYKINFQKNQL